MIHPAESTIPSLNDRGKMVLIAIVIAHPDWSCSFPRSLCAKGWFEAEIVLLFVCLFVCFCDETRRVTFLFYCDWCFLLSRYGYKKNTCFKEKKPSWRVEVALFQECNSALMEPQKLKVWAKTVHFFSKHFLQYPAAENVLLLISKIYRLFTVVQVWNILHALEKKNS